MRQQRSRRRLAPGADKSADLDARLPGAGLASPTPDPAEIAKLAYRRAESRGFESGHDLDDWLWAEAILRAKRQPDGT